MILPFRIVTSLKDATYNFEVLAAGFQKGVTDALATLGLHVGSGAPSIAPTSGHYYFRQDTPGTVNQRLYVADGASWTGVL